MDKKEFSQIRRDLGKTQKQMAQFLGTSLKAIQSFEQGWRNIPVHTERQLLFLMALKCAQGRRPDPVGSYGAALRRRDTIAPNGSFRQGISAGS